MAEQNIVYPRSLPARGFESTSGGSEPDGDGFVLARRVSMRYSKFVGTMKVVLPLVALALIATVVAWPQLNPGLARFQMGFAAVKPEEAAKPRMVNARFTGVDSERRPFTVTAETATQVAAGADLVDLKEPQADITLDDGTWVALSSDEGTYDEKRHDLELRHNVSLFHDSGYEFHTSRARIDMRDGTARGDEPVSGQGPFGLLRSDGFQVLERGRIVVFGGPAKLVIFSGATAPAP